MIKKQDWAVKIVQLLIWLQTKSGLKTTTIRLMTMLLSTLYSENKI